MITSTGKKFRLARAYFSRHPIWCTWQVTYRCNFRCGFCPYWRDPMAERPEQSVEDFRVGGRKLAQLGSMFVSLAGGEPLLRDDLPEVVRVVSEFHLPFFTTNGYLTTPEMARDLYAAGLWGVSVSLDYADASRHDKARGMPGAFDRAVQSLEYFARARIHPWQRLNVMCVLLHDNLDEIEPLLRLAGEYDAYFMVQAYGVRKTGSRHWVHERGGVAEHLIALKRTYPNFLSNEVFLSRFDEALNGGIPGCQAGRAFFNVDSVGDIAVCVEERATPVANLYRDSARTILDHLRTAAAQNACTACWYNCRGEIEMLYRPRSFMLSIPQFVFDLGRPPRS
jgi:MoaA/NifB/PqqE/SkfB family radical SAM enzyme